jgi:hypothetical protein
LTLNGAHQVKPQKILPTVNVVVKTETLDNGILKTTYSSGVVVYVIPSNLLPASSTNSVLACGTLPSNAIGCCCMDFGGYQVLNIGGGVKIGGFLYPNTNFYRFPNPATLQFHIKISISPNPASVIYDDFIIGVEQPQLASCTLNSNFFVQIPNLGPCEIPINVLTERSYQLQGSSTFTTALSLEGSTNYYPAFTPSNPCAWAGDDR